MVSFKKNFLKFILILGSPFKILVGLLGSHEAHRAYACGSGLESGRVDRKESFTVCAGGVGVGELSVTVDGPSRAQVVIQDEANGNCNVEYAVTEPGLYEIDVKFNDAHIAQSPFRVNFKTKKIYNLLNFFFEGFY